MEELKTKHIRIENYLMYGLVIVLPLLFVPQFANAFITPKLALITFGVGIALLVKGVRNLVSNSVTFSASTFDLPVLLLATAYMASAILQTPNKMEAFFMPGTALAVVLAALGFFVVNQMHTKEKSLVKVAILSSTVVLSVIVLFATSGIFKALGMPVFMHSAGFTTLGGPLPALILLVSISPIALSFAVNEKDTAKKALAGVAFALIVLASLASLANILPGKETSLSLPGFSASWSVAVDSLKQNPLLGYGPGNYLSAFNQFRPASYNSTNMWETRFTSGQNFLFTAITETGLLGTASLILLFFFLARAVTSSSKHGAGYFLKPEGATQISAATMAAFMLIFPATPTSLFMFFIVLSLISSSSSVSLGFFNSQKEGANVPFAARIPVIIASLPMVVVVLYVGFQASKILAADLSYKRALDHIVKNEGGQAYDTLLSTINTNPYVDRYRITYAQINLALANSIAQKEGLTDQDRNTIAQLIQQAIREGKAAVALNQNRAGNWEVLASIYKTVMPLAQGADAFAVQTYTQAIALDPLNTNTRIALGGIYYSAKAYEDAIDVFKLAVATKPDHANAHYNLAVAYRENNNIDRAISEMSQVLALVDRNSDDFSVATKVLEELQSKKTGKATDESSTNLTPPSSGEEETLVPPIELPADAEPPTPEATATPTAEPTATPLP